MEELVELSLAMTVMVGFFAMLILAARAKRKANLEMAEGRAPKFSWPLFIFSIYFLAQGVYAFVQECLLERHSNKGFWVNYLFQGLAVLLLAVGITALSNQIKWLVQFLRRHD